MEDLTQPSSGDSENDGREKLKSYLGLQMKVGISDGRVLTGEFMCTDKERNLILGNCDEYIPLSEEVGLNHEQEGLSRMLSLAIVPGHHITSIAIAKKKSSNVDEPCDPSLQDQHQNQHDNQEDHNKKEGTNDAYTEEHGHTHEDIDTPKKHLT